MAGIVIIQPPLQVLGVTRVVLLRMRYGLKNVNVVIAFHRVIKLLFNFYWSPVFRAHVCSARLRQGFGAQPSLKLRQWQACIQ